VCLVHFMVWAAIGGPFLVILVVLVQIKFSSTQPSENYFKVVAVHITLTRTPVSNWTPWYVDLQNTTKVQCLVCGEDFTKKNSRMLSHLGYIPSTGARDSNVKLYKNVKPNVLCAFRECGDVVPTPPELAELQHLQGSAESEEPIRQGSQSSTMTHLVVLLRTLQRLVGPFGILQVLLRSYNPPQGCLVHGHFNKAPFRYCMPRTNDASVTWLGLNSFIVQTFHSLQLDQLASKKR
jgi:hypothetical protein